MIHLSNIMNREYTPACVSDCKGIRQDISLKRVYLSGEPDICVMIDITIPD